MCQPAVQQGDAPSSRLGPPGTVLGGPRNMDDCKSGLQFPSSSSVLGIWRSPNVGFFHRGSTALEILRGRIARLGDIVVWNNLLPHGAGQGSSFPSKVV